MLRYPRSDAKPAFQSWEEIDPNVACSRLSAAAVKELGDDLFLTRSEIDDFLGFAPTAARHDFLYPLFVFAAHTGAGDLCHNSSGWIRPKSPT